MFEESAKDATIKRFASMISEMRLQLALGKSAPNSNRRGIRGRWDLGMAKRYVRFCGA